MVLLYNAASLEKFITLMGKGITTLPTEITLKKEIPKKYFIVFLEGSRGIAASIEINNRIFGTILDCNSIKLLPKSLQVSILYLCRYIYKVSYTQSFTYYEW